MAFFWYFSSYFTKITVNEKIESVAFQYPHKSVALSCPRRSVAFHYRTQKFHVLVPSHQSVAFPFGTESVVESWKQTVQTKSLSSACPSNHWRSSQEFFSSSWKKKRYKISKFVWLTLWSGENSIIVHQLQKPKNVQTWRWK